MRNRNWMSLALTAAVAAASPTVGRADDTTGREVRLVATSGALTHGVGNVRAADGRIGGHVVALGAINGLPCVLDATISGKVERTGLVAGARIRGLAWWTEVRSAGRRIRRASLRGTVTGMASTVETASLQFAMSAGDGAWSGGIEVGDLLSSGELPTATFATQRVRGRRANERLQATAFGGAGFDLRDQDGASVGHVRVQRRGRDVSGSRKQRTATGSATTTVCATRTAVGFMGVSVTTERLTDSAGRVNGSDASVSLVTLSGDEATPVLRPEVVVLHDDGNLTVTPGLGSVVLRVAKGDLPDIEAGDVLVTALGGGAAGEVLSVTGMGSGMLVELQPVAIDRILRGGEIHMDAASLGRAPAKRDRAFSATLDLFRESGTVVLGDEPGPVVEIVRDVAMTLTPTCDVSFDLGGVRTLDLQAVGRLTADLDVTAVLRASASTSMSVDDLPTYATPFAVQLGWLPVTGTVSVHPRFEATASAQGSVECAISAHASADLTLRASYDRERWQPWQVTGGLETDLSFTGPDILGHASASFVAGPTVDVNLNFYGVSGVVLSPRAEVQMSAQSRTAPTGHVYADWSANAVTAIDLSVYLGVDGLPLPFDPHLSYDVSDVGLQTHALGSGTVLLYAPPATVPGSGGAGGGTSTGSGGGSGSSGAGSGTVNPPAIPLPAAFDLSLRNVELIRGVPTVELAWTSSTGVETYQVYRLTTGTPSVATRVAVLGATVSGYVDHFGHSGDSFYYEVRAVNSTGVTTSTQRHYVFIPY